MNNAERSWARRMTSGGLSKYEVAAETLFFMPKAFIDLYEELYLAALGPGLDVRLDLKTGEGGGRVKGLDPNTIVERSNAIVERVAIKEKGLEGEFGNSGVDGSSDPVLPGGVVSGQRSLVVEGGVANGSGGTVVPVGRAQRVRTTTSEGAREGQVTRGGAKGAAHGKSPSARLRAVVGDEYALMLKARVDRALLRTVRGVREELVKKGWVDGSGVIKEKGGVYCVECKRGLEDFWKFCPYCGGEGVSL